MKFIFSMLVYLQFCIAISSEVKQIYVEQKKQVEFLEYLAKRKYDLAKDFIRNNYFNVEETDNDGNNALTILASRNTELDNPQDILILANSLISAGIDINARNKFGQTSLIKAVLSKFPEFVELLINNKANVDIEDIYKYNALMYACINNSNVGHNIVKTLLSTTVNLSIQNDDKQTALDIAKFYDNKTAEKLLHKKIKDNSCCVIL